MSIKSVIEKFEGKELPVTIVKPNRKLGEIYVYGKDRPGLLGDIGSILSKYNVNIVLVHGYVEKGIGRVILLVDLTNAKIDVEKLINELSLKLKIKVKFWTPKFKGLVYDVFTYPPTVSGEPMLIFGHRILADILAGVIRRFKDAGKILLYHLGYDYGRSYAKWLLENFVDVQINLQDLYKVGLVIARSFGLFSSTVNIEDNTVTVKVYDSFESISGDPEYDGCYYIKGFLEGYTTIMLKVKAKCTEVKCKKRGERFCEFKVNLTSTS